MSKIAQRIAVLACMTLAVWGCDDGDDGEGAGAAGGAVGGSGGSVGGSGGSVGGSGGAVGGSGGAVGGSGGAVGGSGGAVGGSGGAVGGSGGAVGGAGGGGEGALNCGELNECLSACEDETCQDACFDDSSAEAQQLLGQVITCFQNSGCAQDDQACLQGACANEINACLGGEGGGEPVDCSSIPAGMNIGSECADAETCGDGGACVSTDGVTNMCLQVCIPGECTDMCADNEGCVGLADESGNPQTLPDGTPVGVCAEIPTGDLANYSICGENAEDACMAGAACLTFAQGQPGFCAPECSQEMQGQACADGMGSCVLGLQGSDDIYCGILCENIGTAEGCPDGLTCQDAGGGGLCLP